MSVSPPPVKSWKPSRRILAVGITLAVLVAVVTGTAYQFRRSAATAERRRALDLADSGPYGEALPALRRCLDRNPDDPPVLGALVRRMTAEKEPVTEVEPYLVRWVGAAPDDPEAFRTARDFYLRQRRYAEAITAARRVLEFDPTDHATRLQFAMTCFRVGRYDDAARECRRLLAGSPYSRADLLVNLAQIETARGDLREAGKLLDEVLAAAPDNSSARLQRGILHYQAGEYEPAVAALRGARPGSYNERELALHHLGLALDRLGRPDEAKVVFDDLARAQTAHLYAGDALSRPSDMAVQLRAARAFLASGEYDDARILLEGAVERLGPDRASLTTLAECYDRLGQADLAGATKARAAALP